ncbi:hypothetical protein DOJK_00911 [Patescibacteria group bacterium]|nr:hypothetical protein DOJK_00911 [Patescibacteria group bacterium]
MKFILLLLLSFSVMADDSLARFDYADGSGNVYHISPNLLEYKPITPNESSSGIYSGGEAVKKVLSVEDYQHLITQVQTAMNNKTIQVEQRSMGSGMIVFYGNQQKTTVLLQQNAQEKQALEIFLKTLR